jgi:NAD(P)-dependent dehydrogenase (short-subunit alcohol dehydrogenase family)
VWILGKDKDIVKRGIQVYSCSPGWVRTDMAGQKAPRRIEEGARWPCNAVYFPWKIDPKYQGQLVFNCKVVISIKTLNIY